MLLWCPIVDDLIARLNRNGVYSKGYANDIGLLPVGKFLKTVSELTHRALYAVETWCGEAGLSVTPIKIDLVVFTRKRKLSGFFEPLLFGVPLYRSVSVKYLGVILDSQLTWRKHVNINVKKAHNLLWACRRSIVAMWGLRDKVVY
jgi:hypothetical protein